ncbi:MAG: GvpL/GvpF family gas vesicle protein, partial [Myxococcota bacterium]
MSIKVRKDGQYAYAIVSADEVPMSYGPIGLDKRKVRAVVEGDVAMVVSPIKNARLRPNRRQLAAHHAVLAEVTSQ